MRSVASALIASALLTSQLSLAADPSLTPAGTWRGSAQFTSSVFGADDPVFFGTFDMVLTITVYGEVSGASPENQCSFAGKAAPITPGSPVASLAITVTGCANPGYNGRYEGNMTPLKADKAEFRIAATHFDRALAGAARRTSVSSSMTRT